MNAIQRLVGGALLRHRDFRFLLSGAAASQLGSQVTLVALPLVAVVRLDAAPFQVGLLTAAETAAFLLVGLPAGAWVDRMRRLPVLIRADLVRCLAVGSVPVAAVAGVLTMVQLYVVALVTGLATVFFEVAHQSFVPQLLPREQLVAGNGGLEVVRSSAQVAGPGSAACWCRCSGRRWRWWPTRSAIWPRPSCCWASAPASRAPNPCRAARCAPTSARASRSSRVSRCCG